MSGKCAGGVELPDGDEPCRVCGATENDVCGRWVKFLEEALAEGQKLADAIAVLVPSDAALPHACLEWKRVHAALAQFRVALAKASPSTAPETRE